jgi:serine protease
MFSEGEVLMFLNQLHRTLGLGMATVVFILAIAVTASVTTAGPPKLPMESAFNRAASAPEEMVSNLIVKPRAGAGTSIASALRAFDASSLSKSANVPLSVLRRISGEAHVIKLEQPVTLSEARVIATRLMHNDSSLEYAEPDRMVYPLTTTPTDPGYGNQWHYFAPAGANKGGTNLPLAWDANKGSPSVVVAVIDNGYRQHIDFAPVLSGFDFIADPTAAHDGDGRDADAQDPSDAVVAGECGVGTPAKNSHWHGTFIIGFIAALMNNGQGGTGVAPDVKILPVRVVGKCGGLTSDVVDGMRWAAGLSVAGVPANPNPAKVLNISIGAPGACGATFQAAVSDIVNAGKVIVVATGNGSLTNGIESPANCSGVIAVTGHAIDGDLAHYANVDPQVAISAPGGGCGKLTFGSTCSDLTSSNGLGVYSTFNSGTTSPGADSYLIGVGTSGAAPHVAGVAALLLSINPTLSPAQIRSILQSSARPFPAGSWCTSSGIGLCGVGLLDAHAALQVTIIPPIVTITNPSQVVAPNITVSLSGAATAAAGRSISSYAWTQLTGASVGTIANQNTANASLTAPAPGTYSFRLIATDSGGLTGTATATVRVNSPPVLTGVADQTVTQDNTLSFVVGATDVDGDAPTFVSVSLPTGATLSPAGTFSWPNATPVGNYVLTYFAKDNDANSSQGTVNISVTADTLPPTMPSSLVGSVLSETQISLTWPASTDNVSVTGYQLERCQGVGCTNFALIATPTTASYTDAGLIPGVSYSYRVRARDATGNFSTYSPISTSTAVPPTTNRTTLFTDPFNRADSADLGAAYTDSYTGFTTGKILSQRLVPSAVGVAAVEHYTGGTTPNDQWSEVTIGALTSGVVAQVGTHVRLTNPTTYSGYRCFAAINQTNKAGIRRFTAGVSTSIGTNDTTTVWGVGDTLRCEIRGTTIKLYRVVGTVETLLTSATDATYASGTTGIYASVAAGGAVTNAQISRFSMGGYSLTTDTTPPTAPGSPTASAPSGIQINLSWPAATDNVGVTSYQVERCPGVGCTTFALIASPSTTGYLDTGLTPGTSYSYRVRAQDATGNVSPYSPIITATTLTSAANRTTLFTDPFNRADNTDLGADYAGGYTGSTTGKIVSQHLLPTAVGTNTVERYTGVTTPANQWCEFTIGTFTGAQGADLGCSLQMSAPPTVSLYLCRASINATNKASLRRFDAGVSNDLGNNTTVVWGPGDVGRCEREGTALRFYRVVGTAETLLLSTTDATYSSGSTGPFAAVNTGGTLTNAQISRFSMGGFGAASAATIAFDAASSSAAGNTTNTISWSHTVGNGTNRFLAVCMQARDTVAGDVAVTTVTANGFPLTKVRADLRTDGGSSFGTELWYLATPGIGPYTIAVTWAGALSGYGVGSATSYFGVNQVAPIDAQAGSGGTGTTLSTAITTVATHALITDCAIAQSDPLTIGVGQTSRVNRTTTGTVDAVGVSTVNDKMPAGTETMDWTQVAAQNWAISAVSLRPAP